MEHAVCRAQIGVSSLVYSDIRFSMGGWRPLIPGVMQVLWQFANDPNSTRKLLNCVYV